MRKLMKATLGMTAKNRKIRNLMKTQRNQTVLLKRVKALLETESLKTPMVLRIPTMETEALERMVQSLATMKQQMILIPEEPSLNLTEILGIPPTNPE